MRENYAKNGRKNDKFIVKCVIRRYKIREDEGKMKIDIKVVGRWTDKGGRKSGESVNIY